MAETRQDGFTSSKVATAAGASAGNLSTRRIPAAHGLRNGCVIPIPARPMRCHRSPTSPMAPLVSPTIPESVCRRVTRNTFSCVIFAAAAKVASIRLRSSQRGLASSSSTERISFGESSSPMATSASMAVSISVTGSTAGTNLAKAAFIGSMILQQQTVRWSSRQSGCSQKVSPNAQPRRWLGCSRIPICVCARRRNLLWRKRARAQSKHSRSSREPMKVSSPVCMPFGAWANSPANLRKPSMPFCPCSKTGTRRCARKPHACWAMPPQNKHSLDW